MSDNRPKVTLIAAMSIDGFIAPADKEKLPSTTWTSKEDWQFFTKKSKAIGTLVMGSKTFETIKRALPERRMVVLTSQPERYTAYASENLQFTNSTPSEIVDALGRQGIREIALCGGAAIYTAFMQANVVDELVLTVEPYVFGEGIKLFAAPLDQQFRLVSQQQLNQQGTTVYLYQKYE